ncbi:MAG TPA: glycosyltransferase family 9 protein, partial [candidate division Zixibacteria bacterium]|nr:glycosyltransferase family 9 protein [candidate division Zixibacteria bacterium]
MKQVEKSGKNLLTLLLGLFLKPEKLDRGKIDFSKVKKILLVRQDRRLGNLILTLPLVSAIRKKLPQSHIGYLADETFAEVLEMCPEIDEVFVLKRSWFWNPFKLLSIILKIRKSNFDLALDLSDENNFSLSNAFLTYLSQAPIRVGYVKAQNKGFLNLEVPIIHRERHAMERHLDLLRFLAGEIPTPEFNL